MSNTIPTGKLDQALGVQSAALSLRVQRQQVLAANIANADTPGYKAVDFDFTRALRAATGGSQGPAAAAAPQGAVAPAVTAPGHQQASRSAYAGLSTAGYRAQYRTPAQPSADGNSVDMDLERARFAENSVKYEAALKFLNGQIKTLLSAIQG
jgi:flagellar basal-body rod protein FlgB